DHRIQIGTTEDNARIYRRWVQGQVHLFTRVKPDARGANYIIQCTLSNHYSLPLKSLSPKTK
ncbi:hypothetical protein LCGC14_3115500, partial [marine sediment metagenome]